MNSASTDFSAVTELSGRKVSAEQLDRLCHRYYWAGLYCRDKDVLEAACGSGQGLGYLSRIAKTLTGGDFSEEVLKTARHTYGNRLDLRQFDAQDLPVDDDSLDVVILFEAIYYLPTAEQFAAECKRVLRPGGTVLIATANKDLYDFNPSPLSHKYYGAVELTALFSRFGFSVKCFGYLNVNAVSRRQKILRPVKKAIVSLGVMPKTAEGKKLLKRIVFGSLVSTPSEIKENMAPYDSPTPIQLLRPDTKHKVIYCAATLER